MEEIAVEPDGRFRGPGMSDNPGTLPLGSLEDGLPHPKLQPGFWTWRSIGSRIKVYRLSDAGQVPPGKVRSWAVEFPKVLSTRWSSWEMGARRHGNNKTQGERGGRNARTECGGAAIQE